MIRCFLLVLECRNRILKGVLSDADMTTSLSCYAGDGVGEWSIGYILTGKDEEEYSLNMIVLVV
jgi:hypothetical protein